MAKSDAIAAVERFLDTFREEPDGSFSDKAQQLWAAAEAAVARVQFASFAVPAPSIDPAAPRPTFVRRDSRRGGRGGMGVPEAASSDESRPRATLFDEIRNPRIRLRPTSRREVRAARPARPMRAVRPLQLRVSAPASRSALLEEIQRRGTAREQREVQEQRDISDSAHARRVRTPHGGLFEEIRNLRDGGEAHVAAGPDLSRSEALLEAIRARRRFIAPDEALDEESPSLSFFERRRLYRLRRQQERESRASEPKPEPERPEEDEEEEEEGENPPEQEPERAGFWDSSGAPRPSWWGEI